VESVLPSGIEAVVADVNSVNTNGCHRIRRVVLLHTAIEDGRWFGVPRASGYKWQYILSSAFSSFHLSCTRHLLLSFECLNTATSFLVWRYIFSISRSPSSFWIIRLISRSQQQNSRCMQVCATLKHSLISDMQYPAINCIIRLHQTHEMQTIGNDECGVCPSVCLSCCSTRQIKMLCGVNTLGALWNSVLHGGPDHPAERGRGSWEKFGQQWTNYISHEWLQLETWNFVCI